MVWRDEVGSMHLAKRTAMTGEGRLPFSREMIVQILHSLLDKRHQMVVSCVPSVTLDTQVDGLSYARATSELNCIDGMIQTAERLLVVTPNRHLTHIEPAGAVTRNNCNEGDEETGMFNFSQEPASPFGAWRRAVGKYRGSLEAQMSPVQPLEFNLQPKQPAVCDQLQTGYVWVLSMTEQFYYDNSILLVATVSGGNIRRVQNTLRANYRQRDVASLGHDWMDVCLLGEGNFGRVYKVTERDTGAELAVKVLLESSDESLFEEYELMFFYFRERNYLVRAHNSPYVVQFFNSFKLSRVDALFMTFECCLSDYGSLLQLLIEHRPPELHKSDGVAALLWEGNYNFMEPMLETYSAALGLDMRRLLLLYILEMFCMLDYLAQCNIVHMDIKPDNLMISNQLHLKLTDFGLVYNMAFVTADSNLFQLAPRSYRDVDKYNNEHYYAGSRDFKDVEMRTADLREDSPVQLNMLMRSPEFRFLQDDSGCKFQSGGGCFLSDLWSMGCVALMTLLAGYHPLASSDPEDGDDTAVTLLGLSHSRIGSDYDGWQIATNQTVFERFLDRGLRAAAGPELLSLVEFLLSIFTERRLRAAPHFIATKTVRVVLEVQPMVYLDIQKLEQLSVFSSQKWTHQNAFLQPVPTQLAQWLTRPRETLYENFSELLETMELGFIAKDHIGMQPGYNLAITK